jgi:predicted secreted protein
MKYIIVGIIAGLLSFIINVKAQDIDVQQRTYTKGLLCANHNDLINDLNTKHYQVRKWWAVNSDNELTELFVNNDNGAWTIVITNREKFSCALIGGANSGANYDIESTIQ